MQDNGAFYLEFFHYCNYDRGQDHRGLSAAVKRCIVANYSAVLLNDEFALKIAFNWEARGLLGGLAMEMVAVLLTLLPRLVVLNNNSNNNNHNKRFSINSSSLCQLEQQKPPSPWNGGRWVNPPTPHRKHHQNINPNHPLTYGFRLGQAWLNTPKSHSNLLRF